MELKLSLEELTCITGDDVELEGSPIPSETEKPQDDESYKVDPNSLQFDDEEVEYEEDIASTEYDDNQSGRPPRQKILDIPIEKLPCPEMQKGTTETTVKSSSVAHWPEASTLFNSSPRLHISFKLIFILTFAGFLLP